MHYNEAIKTYLPQTEQEEKDQRMILYYIDQFKDHVLLRSNEMAHLTSSGFVVNKQCDKVLMAYHNIYQSYAWTGGHADGEPNLLDVAIKEACEETGIKNPRPLSKKMASIDILPVYGHYKKGSYVSTHLHLNVTYLLVADETEQLTVKEDENSAVAWIPIDQLTTYCTEPEMIPIYLKLIKRAQQYVIQQKKN